MQRPETPPEQKSEAVGVGAPAASGKSEKPVDQNQDSDSAGNVADLTSEAKDLDAIPRTDGGKGGSHELQAENPVPDVHPARANSGDGGEMPDKKRRGRPPGSKNKQGTQGDAPSPAQGETPPAHAAGIEMVSINDLEADPLNSGIYTPASTLAQRALTESMKEYGVLTPLLGYCLGNGKFRIRSGHRRAAAAKDAGLTHVPMQLIAPPTGREGHELLVHANIQRDKTNEERIREFLALRKGASERAKARQKAAGKK